MSERPSSTPWVAVRELTTEEGRKLLDAADEKIAITDVYRIDGKIFKVISYGSSPESLRNIQAGVRGGAESIQVLTDWEVVRPIHEHFNRLFRRNAA